MLHQQPQSRHQHGQQTDLTELRLKRLQAQREHLETPYWAEPLPVPPEVDFQADVQNDLKALALIAALQQVADNNGVTITSQLDSWNHGNGQENA